MYLYVIFFLLILFSFFDIYTIPEKRQLSYKLAFISVVLVLFILSAFRVERGTDWGEYENYFNLSDIDFVGWMEVGFTNLNKVVRLISSDYSVMVFVVSSIVFSFKSVVIYRLSPYPLVALFVWYAIFLADIFPVRQTIAISLIMYSMIFVIRRKLWPFLLLTICATMFHYTSIIFISVYFIFRMKISWSSIFIAFVLSFGISVVASDFFSSLLGFISHPFIQERLGAYISDGADNTFGSIYSAKEVLMRGFLNRGVIMLMIFVFQNKLRTFDEVFNGWVNMFVVASVLYFLLCSVNIALGRLVIYLDISQIFIFAYLFKCRMTNLNKLLLFGIMVVYFIYRFRGVVLNYYDLYVPYKSLFWNIDVTTIYS